MHQVELCKLFVKVKVTRLKIEFSLCFAHIHWPIYLFGSSKVYQGFDEFKEHDIRIQNKNKKIKKGNKKEFYMTVFYCHYLQWRSIEGCHVRLHKRTDSWTILFIRQINNTGCFCVICLHWGHPENRDCICGLRPLPGYPSVLGPVCAICHTVYIRFKSDI